MKNPADSHPMAEPSDVAAREMPKEDSPERRPYEKPRVIDHGRLADVALGGSPGTGDSGNTETQRLPGT